jgi:hypothetical protein
MGQGAGLIWFLWLVIIVLAIAVITILAALARSRRHAGGVSPNGIGIHEEKQPIAKRLGEQYPHQYGEDPRGDDIGGNFSTTPTEEDASHKKSEDATSQKQS